MQQMLTKLYILEAKKSVQMVLKLVDGSCEKNSEIFHGSSGDVHDIMSLMNHMDRRSRNRLLINDFRFAMYIISMDLDRLI